MPVTPGSGSEGVGRAAARMHDWPGISTCEQLTAHMVWMGAPRAHLVALHATTVCSGLFGSGRPGWPFLQEPLPSSDPCQVQGRRQSPLIQHPPGCMPLTAIRSCPRGGGEGPPTGSGIETSSRSATMPPARLAHARTGRDHHTESASPTSTLPPARTRMLPKSDLRHRLVSPPRCGDKVARPDGGKGCTVPTAPAARQDT